MLTEQQWNAFKAQFPHDQRMQAVSYDELLSNTNGGKVNWASPPTVHLPGADNEFFSVAGVTVSDCELDIGYVIFDVVCLAIGAVGLRASVTSSTAEAVAAAAKPVLSQLEAAIAKMAAPGASKVDLATGAFTILRTIWSGNCLGAVVSAFVGSLTWYTMLLYAATAMGTIVAALATDGAAFVAEVVIELATFGFLVSDSVKAYEACS
ncbi:hypothetical protein [Actinoplanes sp. N902-109]|uniref:hypothetical protein n=1 Tax=Actinoplanes sp. (strain N902-109) TaxID=649831 RepID=UPI00032953FA|nr:hypothetical protein [Actinoplanes sp. N902-109]AGL17713.1 hypothetical protein L083_4203 [Actinoplanes sp. N902-109]